MRYVLWHAFQICLSATPELREQHMVFMTLSGTIFDWRDIDPRLRMLACISHGVQTIVDDPLEVLMGEQGLKNEATEAQGMYRLSYVQAKYPDLLRAALALRTGNNANAVTVYMSLCNTLRNMIAKVAQTRWLTVEKRAAEIIALINVEATPELLEALSAFYNDEDEMKTITSMATTMDGKKTSYFAVVCLFLASHCPGGTNGDGARNFSLTAAFLTSPRTRVSLVAAAGLKDPHERFLAFANSKSDLFPQTHLGHRALESIQEFHLRLEKRLLPGSGRSNCDRS
jgi:hypothetical protein